MKNIFLLIFSVFLLLSCSPEKMPDGKTIVQKTTQDDPIETPSITASETTFSFSADGGSSNVTITANFAWETISSPSWITVSPSSGSKGNTSLTIKADKNTDTAIRTGTITIGKSSSATVSITVTQSAASVEDEISASVTSLDFVADGGSKNLSVTSNFSWETISKPSWIKVSPSTGSKGSTSVSITAEKNTSTSSRSGTIKIGKNSSKTVSITVNQSGASSDGGSSITIPVTNSISIKMIKVDGGTFTMGATSEQGSYGVTDNEMPTHSVTLSTYYIGETEVTQELWEAVMGRNPSSFKSSRKPVEQVRWDDCQTFITRLNSLTGRTFRLPTEAEWEFAARGGNKSQGYKYSGSNTLDEVAWYTVNSYDVGSSSLDYGTHNVGTKKANELGLYDMSGNVKEWCQDWWGNYSSGNQTNPTGPSTDSMKVFRGGSWFSDDWGCRVSVRYGGSPSYSTDNLGLRLTL